MRFFDREDKIERLRQIRARSMSEAQFTVITGRRRVGKTELVQHAFADSDFVYLFVSRKSETELVEGFVSETNRVVPEGVTTRNEIEQVVGRAVGGYLTRLESDYHLISKHLPFAAKTTRQVRYQIDDPFYRFWFRFVFKYDYMVQMKAFPLLRKIVRRDYPVFSGKALESYFRAKLTESGEWTKIGNWWDRKGENELDLVAENELDGTFLVAEVKREAKRIDLDAVREKYAAFAQAAGLGKKQPKFVALSLADM